MKTPKEILEEIASKYTLTTRSVSDMGNCCYRGPGGRECAFAMMVKPEYKLCLSEGRNSTTNIRELGAEIIKDEYLGHPIQFYRECQKLHDDSTNWNHEGLSESGKTFMKKIENDYPNYQDNG